ncbi:AUGMIN subunit 5-like [Malus sylvestris]|uniref:AUGMIN subunit 5-like n=1 Tax=Malus sylvestris TaxID=3752 RepID=UPI0021ABA896|nr:AUGMIN subunit 5-like [Malus sylvestris]
MEVWAKEREVAGLRASLNTLMSEIQRLNKLCAERKEAEDSLKKKWKKIEEFDYRRSELEIIYTTLLKVNMDAAAFWNQQPLAAREYASSTIIPACTVVMDLSNSEKHLIEREVSAFDQSPDNSLYMIPAIPQHVSQPNCMTDTCGSSYIFNFTGRQCDNWLLLQHPCECSVSHEEHKSSNVFSIVGISCRITVAISNKLVVIRA